jgi:hypothetical protein
LPATGKKHNKSSGIHMMSGEVLEPRMAKGMALNLWANDVVMMMNAAKAALSRLRK